MKAFVHNGPGKTAVEERSGIRDLGCGRGVKTLKVWIEFWRHVSRVTENTMIEQLTDFPDNVAAFRCTGQVTKDDYVKVLVPTILGKLRAHDKVRVYYETAADFAGFDPGAMWEDFKVGVEHLTRWDRVAVVTDVDWIGKAVRFFAFLMPATTRLFSRAEAGQARVWISD